MPQISHPRVPGKVNTVPDGEYVVVISVLKALGNDNNPDDGEIWTSPVISIARLSFYQLTKSCQSTPDHLVRGGYLRVVWARTGLSSYVTQETTASGS